MAFTEVTTDITGRLLSIVGETYAILDEQSRYLYGHDETEDHSFLPDIVLKPGTAQEVSAIMHFSNEHGIGIAKRPYMPIAMREANLELMRQIKKAFDPKGILNPGKIF